MTPSDVHMSIQPEQANRHIFWTLLVIVTGLLVFTVYLVFIKEHEPEKKIAVNPFSSIDFVNIQPGFFFMGSDGPEAYPDEQPVHKVALTRLYSIGKTEVTQAQWSAVMDHNPSLFPNPEHPVDNVGWGDIQVFLNRLNKVSNCKKCYRLPTEAEWEYAARAGSTTIYSFGNNSDSLENYAWYADNANFSTHPVATKMPNAWGLYDMQGNVYEWVQDFYGPYQTISVTDPVGATVGTQYILRGGSWTDSSREQRLTYRDYYAPNHRHNFFGFRLVRTTNIR